MDTLHLKRIINQFLAEDISSGDITSEGIFSSAAMGEAVFIAKGSFLAAGMEKVAGTVFQTRNPAITIMEAAADGTSVAPGDILLRMNGPVLDLLTAERVALNLVQRLSGIATLTARFVEKIQSCPARIVDTRKTTPGLRDLEKYAVRVGGGNNHRFNLADGILIKDNHIAACGSIRKAVAQVRQHAPHTLKVEVETENLQQVEECISCGVDIIMLDNMSLSQMEEAVNMAAGKALVEASGGVILDTVAAVAATGVDLISVGALTHSAPACDISMKFIAPEKNRK